MSPPLDTAPSFTEASWKLFPCAAATLIENLRGKIPRDHFKELKSAVKVVCKRLKRDPQTWVIHSAKELVDAVHSIHPLRDDIHPDYLRVTSSRVMKVMRLNGVEFLSGQCKTELPEPWANLITLARLIEENRVRSLIPFVRSRVRVGRMPGDVTQIDFEEYCVEVDQTSQRKNKLGSKQGIRRDWNFFAGHVPDWPQVQFTMQSKRNDYLLPEDQMPPAIKEFDAKEKVPLRGNRKSRRRRRLSNATKASRKYTFRRIISAAVDGGIDVNRLQTIADVCEREVLETAYNRILERGNKDGTCDVCRLAVLMHAVAEQWVGVTGAELQAHQELCEDFEHIQQGMAEKNQRLLAQFTSDKAIAAFLKTPKRVIDRYDGVAELNEHDCVEIQMAAAMAVLTRVLIRMENLKQIEDGVHLIESGWGSQRSVLLIFGEDEVKNTEYLETLLSPRVVAVLDAYKQRAWPKLKRGNSKYLFPGYGGKHKAASGFGRQLADFVLRETGIRVTPHQFRHLGGYFHLLRYPGDYASVQKMLGHRKLETTIKYYTGTMDRRAAFKKYDTHIDARIDEAEAAEVASKKLRIKSYV